MKVTLLMKTHYQIEELCDVQGGIPLGLVHKKHSIDFSFCDKSMIGRPGKIGYGPWFQD